MYARWLYSCENNEGLSACQVCMLLEQMQQLESA